MMVMVAICYFTVSMYYRHYSLPDQQPDNQTDSQIDKQEGRQPDRQAGRQADRLTDLNTKCCFTILSIPS
jgi:hypothetical protein